VYHRFPIRVRFYELDPYHHVNHAVYIQYFEAARIDLLREAGMTLQGMKFKRVTSRWRQRLLRGDEVMVEQELGAAVTNLAGRPIRFPERMVQMLRPYLAGP
jgi:acyl-CoA thioesterase FadM